MGKMIPDIGTVQRDCGTIPTLFGCLLFGDSISYVHLVSIDPCLCDNT